MRAAVVELGPWRSGCADGADDLVAELDHHAAAEEHDMRQLGERRDRIFAFRALSQRQGVVLKRYAGVRLVVRAIDPPWGVTRTGSCRSAVAAGPIQQVT